MRLRWWLSIIVGTVFMVFAVSLNEVVNHATKDWPIYLAFFGGWAQMIVKGEPR